MTKKCSFCNQKKDGFLCRGFRGAIICEACVKLASDTIAEIKAKSLPPVVGGDTRTIEEKLEASLAIVEKSKTERRLRFGNTTGAFGYMTAAGPTGANLHPDRCTCQGNDPTPHKHYRESPYSCARCSKCKGYSPAIIARR